MLVLLGGTVGAYAYDNSQKDKIAGGVTVDGVDIGGLSAADAKALLRNRLIGPLRGPVRVRYAGRTWSLPGARLRVRANIDAIVDQALAASRDGGLPGRLVRYVTGGSVDERIRPEITYSQRAINRFVRRVAADIDRDPRNASVSPGPDSLNVVPARAGLKVRDVLLTRRLDAAATDAGGRRVVTARVHATKPQITTDQVASQYPSYLTLDRSSFTLRLWKDLELAKSYTVAVGQQGLETPAGLYHIQDKQVNPSWHVPDSAWAGDLAGQVIPPGPEDPIKARWLGIFDGAGIHGTDETWSLGTAASHGCVRMSIPDVIDLYDRVDVGTPIYIG
ncbi:MAG: L,D-transpeptidase/peptidoglycan binding protein [Solirubrobacterales bacterium]